MDSKTHVKKIRCNTNRKAKATVQQWTFSNCQVPELVVDGCYLIRMCPERICMEHVSGNNFWFSHQGANKSSQKYGTCRSWCLPGKPHFHCSAVRNRSSQSNTWTLKVTLSKDRTTNISEIPSTSRKKS